MKENKTQEIKEEIGKEVEKEIKEEIEKKVKTQEVGKGDKILSKEDQLKRYEEEKKKKQESAKKTIKKNDGEKIKSYKFQLSENGTISLIVNDINIGTLELTNINYANLKKILGNNKNKCLLN